MQPAQPSTPRQTAMGERRGARVVGALIADTRLAFGRAAMTRHSSTLRDST